MKKIITIVFIFSLLLHAQVVLAEEIITNFDVEIVINKDATVDVTETILYDFGVANKHGIYRDIPVKYKTNLGDNRSIELNNVHVMDEGGFERKFVVEKKGKNKRIKIGTASKLITGEQAYVISYTINGAINYFDGHDELYWNVTGAEWPVDIKTLSASVRAPGIIQVDCFVGEYGSTQKCDSINQGSGIAQFVQDNIVPGEGATVVVGMPVGAVDKSSIFKSIIKFVIDNLVLLIPIGVFFFMWDRWNTCGKDPKGRGTVVPYYESPNDLSPAEVGMIVDNKVHSRDISALLINLAVKGCIHIRKQDNDYIFIKVDNAECILVSEEQMLYDSIFGTEKREISISSLTNTFYLDFERIKARVENKVIQKKYYIKNPQNIKEAYLAIGFFMFVGSFFAVPFLGIVIGVAILFSSLSVMGFGFFMSQRTRRGAIAQEQILGLKLYMETAEKERINFHNAPEKEPKHFEILLPYAMALGVERKWAKQFEDIYKGKPDWYEGAETFGAAAFASEMSVIGSSTASAMTSQPASASSGSSGFSGGGSGGGFGGGGGGSW